MNGMERRLEIAERRLQEVKAITQQFVDQQGHNRCWYYPDLFNKLAETLEITPTRAPKLPPRSEFEEGCKRYQNEQYGK